MCVGNCAVLIQGCCYEQLVGHRQQWDYGAGHKGIMGGTLGPPAQPPSLCSG